MFTPDKNEAASLTNKEKFQDYLHYFTEADKAFIQKRADNYQEIANHYYDLVTDFYEYGWGYSFHFAYPQKGESYELASKRLEHYLAYRLNIQKGQKALDVGCGVGGPMRGVAHFSGANVIGLNNNAYQIKKGEKYNQASGLSSRCSFVKADYMQRLPFDDNSFDGTYTLEAMCYAPDLTKVYTEILRVLKPGAYFTGTDWCMTLNYDPTNPLHFRLKEAIAKGNGIYDLFLTSHLIKSLQDAGFEIIETKDLAYEARADCPWYHPLESKWSLKGFLRTAVGRFMTKQIVRILEFLHLVPRGTTSVSQFLNEGADSLVQAGKLEIFTPGFFFLAKKPHDK